MLNFEKGKYKLQDRDDVLSLTFCKWTLAYKRTISRILFTDEDHFIPEEINKTRNEHIRAFKNPHTVTQKYSQYRFSVNVLCEIYKNHSINSYY